MDPNFVLRHDREPIICPEGLLRRHPTVMPQLYFYSTQSMGADKAGLYFSQAVAASPDPNDQSVRVVDFLKRKYTTRETQDPNVNFALDERAAKLYLGFDQNSTHNSELALRIFNLDFDPVDHLGYRRILVRSDCLHVVKTDPLVTCVLGGLAICPATGKLFGHYGMLGVGSRQKLNLRWAEIEQPKAKDSVLRAKLSEHKFEAQNASRSVNCRGMIFSKLGHLVSFFGFSRKQSSNKAVFICSYDNHLNLVRSLAFDPIDLVCQFFETDTKALSIPEHIAWFLSMLVGRMHKYVLFQFGFHILAVKWPNNWYVGKHLPPVQHSRVINLKDFMDQQQVYEKNRVPVTPIILTNTHLYVLFHLQDKPNEIKRLALSPRFKDYRQCANCGVVEKRKRKNNDGKRIAQFKVCRLCKEKNFHLFYLISENACHYCSDECVKKHWKIHKEMHKRSKLNRKKHSLKG